MAKSASLQVDFKKSLEKGRPSNIKSFFSNSKTSDELFLKIIKFNCQMVAFTLVYGILTRAPDGMILAISGSLIAVNLVLEIAWVLKRNPC